MVYLFTSFAAAAVQSYIISYHRWNIKVQPEIWAVSGQTNHQTCTPLLCCFVRHALQKWSDYNAGVKGHHNERCRHRCIIAGKIISAILFFSPNSFNVLSNHRIFFYIPQATASVAIQCIVCFSGYVSIVNVSHAWIQSANNSRQHAGVTLFIVDPIFHILLPSIQ